MTKFPMKVIPFSEIYAYKRVQITLMVMILKYWNSADNRYSLVKGISFKWPTIVSFMPVNHRCQPSLFQIIAIYSVAQIVMGGIKR